MGTCLGLRRRGDRNIGCQGTMPRCIEIYDFQNVTVGRLLKQIVGMRAFARALSIGQEHYPENLRKAFIINAPRGLARACSVCFRVLDEQTIAKLSIAADDNRPGLSQYIDAEKIDAVIYGSLEKK